MPAVADGNICTGCAGRDRPECVANCPYDAIGLAGGRAVVDARLCDECKICVEACPVHALRLI